MVLVLAAAVIVGSTMGILSNMKYITNQVKANSQLELEKEQQAKKTNDNSSTVVDLKKEVQSAPVSSTAIQGSSKGTTNTSNAPKVKASKDDNSLMVISQTEQKEIEFMLASVDSTKESDYSSRLKRFQEKHALSVTGILDSMTLNMLIEQVKLQKASQYSS